MANIQPAVCRSLLTWMTEHVKNIVIITHTNPDGDALGSSLGLNSVLQHAGYHSTVVFPNDFPPVIPDLEAYRDWLIFDRAEQQAEEAIKAADLLFFLDFNDPKRMGKPGKIVSKLEKRTVLIDHHPEPAIATPFLFSDTTVSSTAELVHDFVVKMGWEEHLDATGASALLTGIIADTASFSHNARRAELYSTVASLIDKGADQLKIQEALFNTNSEDRLRLLGYALSEKMELFPEYHAAIIALTREELRKYNFKIGDTEGFVNYPLSIKGILFSVFFLENEEKIKLSFRSKGGFAVNELAAKHFNGGGHHNAAGGESYQSMGEAIQRLITLFPQYAEALERESLLQG